VHTGTLNTFKQIRAKNGSPISAVGRWREVNRSEKQEVRHRLHVHFTVLHCKSVI